MVLPPALLHGELITGPSAIANDRASAVYNLAWYASQLCFLILILDPPFSQTGLCVYEIDDPALR